MQVNQFAYVLFISTQNESIIKGIPHLQYNDRLCVSTIVETDQLMVSVQEVDVHFKRCYQLLRVL